MKRNIYSTFNMNESCEYNQTAVVPGNELDMVNVPDTINDTDETAISNPSDCSNGIDEEKNSNSTAVLLVTISIMILNQFIPWAWLKWAGIGLCLCMLCLPYLVEFVRMHRQFTIEKALKIMRNHGLDASIEDGVIHLNNNGKINIVRLERGCLLKVERVFIVDEDDCSKSRYEEAALSTMKEVPVAKVAIETIDSEFCLSFATENLCPNTDIFEQCFPLYMQLLNEAEARHRYHLNENKPAPKRIGFENYCLRNADLSLSVGKAA